MILFGFMPATFLNATAVSFNKLQNRRTNEDETPKTLKKIDSDSFLGPKIWSDGGFPDSDCHP